jgi:transcriptional regulator of aromatic amino acid metabolism
LSNNDVLIILSKYQKRWEEITNNLLFSSSELKATDIVQEMYIKVFDELTKNNLQIENIIVNNKPHYGIVKNIIKRLIQVKSKNIKHHLSIEELNLQIEDTKEPVNNIDAKIDEVLKDVYWFDRKLFNLYRKEFHSIRSLSKATKISHVTVHKTISKCKKLLLKKVKL